MESKLITLFSEITSILAVLFANLLLPALIFRPPESIPTPPLPAPEEVHLKWRKGVVYLLTVSVYHTKISNNFNFLFLLFLQFNAAASAPSVRSSRLLRGSDTSLLSGPPCTTEWHGK
jgi:hypothetical protein